MKRFLILILFSLFFPIQNSSAVSPSLDETIEFLVNGDYSVKTKWSISDCNLTTYFKHTSGEDRENIKIDLNKVNLKSFDTSSTGFTANCIGECYKFITSYGWKSNSSWFVNNGVDWKRNSKALSHLFGNFCTGAKSAF